MGCGRGEVRALLRSEISPGGGEAFLLPVPGGGCGRGPAPFSGSPGTRGAGGAALPLRLPAGLPGFAASAGKFSR